MIDEKFISTKFQFLIIFSLVGDHVAGDQFQALPEVHRQLSGRVAEPSSYHRGHQDEQASCGHL